jgi:hypothetical protein
MVECRKQVRKTRKGGRKRRRERVRTHIVGQDAAVALEAAQAHRTLEQKRHTFALVWT